MSLSPSLFFPFYLLIFFLPPSIWCLCELSVGVWVMCFLLLASSRTASLVCLAPVLPSLYDVFLLCLGVGQGMSLSVCSFHHCQTVYLRLSAVHVSLFLLCLVAFLPCIFPLLSSHSPQKSHPRRFYFASSAVSLCAFESSPVAIYLEVRVDWNALLCFTLHGFTCVFCSTMCWVFVFCQFWVTFSVSFELYVHGCLQASVENIMKEKMPKKGGRWWFSWRSRNSDSKSVSTQIHTLLVFIFLNLRYINYTVKSVRRGGRRQRMGAIFVLQRQPLCASGISDRGRRRARRELTNHDLSKQVTSDFQSP